VLGGRVGPHQRRGHWLPGAICVRSLRERREGRYWGPTPARDEAEGRRVSARRCNGLGRHGALEAAGRPSSRAPSGHSTCSITTVRRHCSIQHPALRSNPATGGAPCCALPEARGAGATEGVEPRRRPRGYSPWSLRRVEMERWAGGRRAPGRDVNAAGGCDGCAGGEWWSGGVLECWSGGVEHSSRPLPRLVLRTVVAAALPPGSGPLHHARLLLVARGLHGRRRLRA